MTEMSDLCYSRKPRVSGDNCESATRFLSLLINLQRIVAGLRSPKENKLHNSTPSFKFDECIKGIFESKSDI